MPHYYASRGTPIQLDEALDAVGVRFEGKAGPAIARTASRSLSRGVTTRAGQPPVSGFGRFMVLHDARASVAPVETVVNALPRRLASRVSRTMPVFVERKSKLKLVATEQILAQFKPKASPARIQRLLGGLGLTIAGTSEFDVARKILVPSTLRRASRTLDLANRLVEAEDVVAFAAPNFLAEVRKGAASRRSSLPSLTTGSISTTPTSTPTCGSTRTGALAIVTGVTSPTPATPSIHARRCSTRRLTTRKSTIFMAHPAPASLPPSATTDAGSPASPGTAG